MRVLLAWIFGLATIMFGLAAFFVLVEAIAPGAGISVVPLIPTLICYLIFKYLNKNREV